MVKYCFHNNKVCFYMALSTDSHKSQFYPVLYMVDGPCSVSPSSKNLVFNYRISTSKTSTKQRGQLSWQHEHKQTHTHTDALLTPLTPLQSPCRLGSRRFTSSCRCKPDFFLPSSCCCHYNKGCRITRKNTPRHPVGPDAHADKSQGY